LISATACGQLLSPKRIIFEKDTGIFFPSSQEIILLVKLKQLEACEEEKEQWILYANNADKQIGEERIAYDKLFKQYVSLEGVATDFENKYREEFRLHQETKNTLTIQINKKQTWAKIAVGSLLVNGTLIYIMSR
jgi:uncharacterized protein (UPF0333 family)